MTEAEEIQQLKGMVERQGRQLGELQAFIDVLRLKGGNELLAGHGFQQFAGGIMRTTQQGLQFKSSIWQTAAASLTFVEEFFDGSALPAVPGVEIQGYATPVSGDASGVFRIVASDSIAGNVNNEYAAILRMIGGAGSLTEGRVELEINTGGTWGGVYVYSSDTLRHVEIRAFPLGLARLAADPTTTLRDGYEWYRTDTDRYRGQQNSVVLNFAMEGDGSELTIATGVITATTSFHAVDTQADGASDDLDTINGGQTGQVLVIHAANSARDVVAKDGTGNLKLAGDCTLDNVEDTLTLIYDGANWLELARSGNGA